MSILSRANRDNHEKDKFIESSSTPGQVAIAVVSPDGANVGGGTQYTDAGTPPASPVGNAIEFNKTGTWQTVGNGSANGLPIQAIDGAIATLGAKADAKSTATDTTAVTIMQVLKEISAMAQAPAAIPAGTNLIGQIAASNETATIYSGATALTPTFATIVASSSGATTLVSLVSSKKIRVLALYLTSNGTVNVKFQSHVTPTDLTGLAYLVANTGFVLPYNPVGWFQSISGEALDINLSGNIAVGGALAYIAV